MFWNGRRFRGRFRTAPKLGFGAAGTWGGALGIEYTKLEDGNVADRR